MDKGIYLFFKLCIKKIKKKKKLSLRFNFLSKCVNA